jgi:hypothetical protein
MQQWKKPPVLVLLLIASETALAILLSKESAEKF